MKNLIKIISVIFLAFFCTISFVVASETTGTLNTGLNTGINGTVVVAPNANVASGTYTSAQDVSLSATGSQSIHYTINGSTPVCLTGNVYSSPILISTTTTLKAIACYANSNESSISSFEYTINAVTPPPGGGGGGGGAGGGGAGGGVPETTEKAGDTNSDSKVDELDFAFLMAQWGQTGSGLSGDLNKDGIVDEYDFAILMANWGN